MSTPAARAATSSSFAALGVSARHTSHLADLGITEPTAIQAATIPDGLAGRDICGRAPTGSGKTLAFGLPLLANVGKGKSGRPRGLVLAPTRELAEQISQELTPLARLSDRRVVAVYGGVGYEPQRRALRKGADVVIACPGRLADLVQQGDVTLADVDQVVVDEADRMADMGFLPEVERLLDTTADRRQTVLFSATLDGQVKALTDRYQHKPVYHEIGPARPDITRMQHLAWPAERTERVELTARAIRTLGPTIVFTRTRHGADRLVRQLRRFGVEGVAIHGGRSQGQRTRALDQFAAYRAEALIATDVAARGIHVDDVAAVVHFDPPEDGSTYVHRSGRTARAGAEGVVISLVADQQRKDVGKTFRGLGLDVSIDAPDELAEVTQSDNRKPGPNRAASNGSGSNGNGSKRRRAKPRRTSARGATGKSSGKPGNGKSSGKPGKRSGGAKARKRSGNAAGQGGKRNGHSAKGRQKTSNRAGTRSGTSSGSRSSRPRVRSAR